MFKKAGNFLLANKIYAAYNFNRDDMKLQARASLFKKTPEERIVTIHTAHDSLMRNGLVSAALELINDYRSELIKPEYNEFRGGSYDELVEQTQVERQQAFSSEISSDPVPLLLLSALYNFSIKIDKQQFEGLLTQVYLIYWFEGWAPCIVFEEPKEFIKNYYPFHNVKCAWINSDMSVRDAKFQEKTMVFIKLIETENDILKTNNAVNTMFLEFSGVIIDNNSTDFSSKLARICQHELVKDWLMTLSTRLQQKEDNNPWLLKGR